MRTDSQSRPVSSREEEAAMESYDVIANQPVVIDNGSGVIKAGFAGDQIPKYCFPNYVGRPKHIRVMAGALEGDLFIGPKAEEHRGLLSIRYPMEHGIVKDWNDMERIWQYVYSKDQLQTFSEEHPVLLTEAPLNPRKNRERAAEVFFETFNVPALFISMQAVLSLYATGRTTGVVLDAGDGVTHAVPIYEGFAMPHSIMRIDIAGRDVSRFLRLYLRKEGYDFHTSAEFEIVKTIKERACYLSINPQKDETLETEKAQYYLPDGSTIEIGPARFRAPELLFRPDLIGEECEGIHEVLVFAIQKSDMDLRRTLFSNIVLSGGSTLFKGFGDRLLSEVKKLAPKDVKIRISAPQERLYSTWIGGSILASLDTFKKMWVSKKEYEEDGARAIHRKTF
ncbi:alpha-centractin [Pelobates cultripes]|uniref:Alpha-centractin n=2 Tax=Pelobates TaxID=61615 RepID=A0AAD1TD97_PELCU|nr:alpha-centractin [Pelobates cultripes]